MDDVAHTEPSTLEDAAQEGMRLAQASMSAGVTLRLIGGVAVWARCPSARQPPLSRAYGDVDFAGLARDRAAIVRFFESQGYEPDKLFNALHGAQRLNFSDPVRGRPLDVILDRFAMCHVIDLHDRLALEPLTIPLTDLLVTKLQIVRLNDKDVLDLLALLADSRLGGQSRADIDLARMIALTRDDWGLEHTVRRTLGAVRDHAATAGLSLEMTQGITETIDGIVAAFDAAPKGMRWRVRARLGERIRWYQEPEDVRR